MADQAPLISLAAARERTIADLSTAFANDDLTMDELESRIERAYKARTMDEIVSVTADLRVSGSPPTGPAAIVASPSAAVVTPSATPGRDRILGIMSSSRRQGVWVVPQHLEVVAIMSDTVIDFSRATLPPGIIDVHVRAMMTSLKIILPPGIRVASRLTNIMSDVSTDDERDHSAAAPGAPVIRLTGWATMSSFETVVRRRDDFG